MIKKDVMNPENIGSDCDAADSGSGSGTKDQEKLGGAMLKAESSASTDTAVTKPPK